MPLWPFNRREDDSSSRNMPELQKGVEDAAKDIIRRIREVAGPDANYLITLPEAAQRAVIRDAKDAYRRKARGRTLEVFTQDMALSWLAKEEVFKRTADRLGFVPVNRVGKNEDTPVLGFTLHGTIVTAGRPEEDGMRLTHYMRIKERVNKSYPAAMRAFKEDLAVGRGISTDPGFITSGLVHLRAAPGTTINVLEVAEELSTNCMMVDEETLQTVKRD